MATTIYLRRHRFIPGAQNTSQRLPIVAYSEISHDGPFVTAAVTCAEDGMWKSDVLRLAAYAAADIQATLTGKNALTVLSEMFDRQKAAAAENPGH